MILGSISFNGSPVLPDATHLMQWMLAASRAVGISIEE